MITFATFGEEAACKKLWNRYSQNEILWDVWDFRKCFHTKSFEFNFKVGYEGGKEIGMIPLVFDTRERVNTYFGDTFPEQNKFFVGDEDYKEYYLYYLLYECPYYTTMYYIHPDEAYYSEELEPGDKRYFLNLDKYENNFDTYLASFTKKHRKNLKYDLKQLEKLGCSIEKNRMSDLDILGRFNKERWGKESDYHQKEFVQSMQDITQLAAKKKYLDLISIKIAGKTEAVGLGIIYKGCYSVLSVGRNPAVKNSGKLLIAEQIKSAISKKCHEVDFLSTESNWKELWNLDSEQLYDFYC